MTSSITSSKTSLKILKPVTPGLRGRIVLDKSTLWRGKPEKSLTKGAKKISGRNNHGRVTCRGRGGSLKRRLRTVHSMDLHQKVTVQRFEYDPHRSSLIALIVYESGKKGYIIAPDLLKEGDVLKSGDLCDGFSTGYRMMLKNIPSGSLVHDVALDKNKNHGILVRSAGSSSRIMSKKDSYVFLKLPSGELRKVHEECYASLGMVSHPAHKDIKIGKAGFSRKKGIRPTVRGVAKNPHDHPHGGGEGKTSGGRHPVTPWGHCTKGKKTRNNKRTDRYIQKRRK